MENTPNTPQNPELEQVAVQEENAAIVEVTMDHNNPMLPTDEDQTGDDSLSADETPQTISVIEDRVVEFPEGSLDNQPGDMVAEISALPADAVASFPEADELPKETIADPVPESVETAGETDADNFPDTTEPILETHTEPAVEAEISIGAVAEELVSGSSEEPAETTSNLSEVPELQHEGIAEEHIDMLPDDHMDEVTDENAEHIASEADTNFDNYTREQLVEMLEKAVGDTDFNAIKTRIALVKVAFLKKKKDESLQQYETVMEEGAAKEELAPEQDALDIKFNELFAIYRANKARHTEEQEKIKQENLKKKFLILDGLKALISSEETLKKTYDEFKILQERWKGIGMVPRTEINNLWQNYHFLVEKFFEKVKLNKELKDLDLRKNMEAKIALCEEKEELLLETSVIKSFKKLQKYHEEWKELGPVPADKKEEIWERFKNATDKINDRRREHYSLIEEDQEKNLETKIALCEQAEIVVGLPNESLKDWQDNTNKVNDLLKIWKNIGPIPQKVNNDTWKRFKTALDSFFAIKKEYFDKLKEQQTHNYNLKVELCMQAEALNSSTDWKTTTNELIRLQNEWKKIGPVPKKNSDKIWKRFRTACDEFFNAKQSYFSHVQAGEGENLAKKLTLIARLKEHQFGDNKSANLDILKTFQREWTEIGHVPMKEKDKLHNEFRTLVNEHLDKLKISEVEMSTVSFQAKFDHLKNDPNARRVIGKEREFLATKISKMKEEIILWENNIGFFAKSKSASVVKEEFESKINKAKSELKVLEAKMKILKQQGG